MLGRLLPFQLDHRQRQHFKAWSLRLAIIGGLLLVSTLLPLKASTSQFEQIILLGVGAAGVLVLMRWPAAGLVVMPLVGMNLPITGPAGLNGAMLLVGLLLALWVAEMVVQRHEIELAPSPIVFPLLALLAISVISFTMGQLPWYTFAPNAALNAQLGGFAIFALSIAACLLVANQIRSLVWLKWLVGIFLGISTVFIVLRTVPGMGFLRVLFQGQAIGGMFWAWLPAIALSQALFNDELKPHWRVGLIGLVAGCLYVGLFQNYAWKSGWVPSVIAIGAILAFHSWRIGALLGLIGALPASSLVAQILLSDDYSFSTRVDAWQIMAEIVKVNPIWGLGFANYYWYTPLFAIRGFVVEFNSHNNYIDVIAQTGLIGLVCLLWFFVAAGLVAGRLKKRVPGGFPRAYVYGAFGGLAGTATAAMLGDWLLPFVYNIGLAGFRTGVLAWLFLGGLVVLEQLYPEQPSPKG